MPNYRAKNAETLEVVEYQADAPMPEHLSPPWEVFRLVEFGPVDDDQGGAPPTVYGGRRVISKLEFLRLFTPEERITIRAAAQQSPVVQDFMHMLELAESVNMDDVETQVGVPLLEQSGLIGAGRAQEILRA